MSGGSQSECLCCLSQRGHVALFVLVLLPVLLSLTILAVDLSGWNALRDTLQREAERIAFQGANALPNKEQAKRIVVQTLSTFPKKHSVALDEGPIVDDGATMLRVGLTGQYDATFDHFLRLFIDQDTEKHTFGVRREAVVQIVPADVVLVLPDGESMRPKVGEDPWQNEIDWPYSWYFDCGLYEPPEYIEGDSNSLNDWPESKRYRWATQSCYNPVFSSVKAAAISLIDHFSASNTNRIGVIFTPGQHSTLPYSYLRHLKNTDYMPGGFFDANNSSANATWGGYVETSSLLGDEACVLFSYFDNRYSIPSLPLALHSPHLASTSCELLQIPQCDHGGSPYNVVSACYLENGLKLREAVYWRAAKPQPPNTSAAIKRAISELIISTEEDLIEEQNRRGNLAVSNLRKIILITDNLPNPAEPDFEVISSNLRPQGIELIIAGFLHPYLSTAETTEFEHRLSALKSLANRINTAHQSLRVFNVDSPEALNQQLVPKLIALGRATAIRRSEEAS